MTDRELIADLRRRGLMGDAHMGDAEAFDAAADLIERQAARIAELLAAKQEPVMWLEAEESCRGKTLEELLTPNFPLYYSALWHYSPKQPVTSNPIFPLYAAPVAQPVSATLTEIQ